jgi:hypothetical protein
MFLIFLFAMAVLALVVVSSFISAMRPMIKVRLGLNQPTEHVGATTHFNLKSQRQHGQKSHL